MAIWLSQRYEWEYECVLLYIKQRDGWCNACPTFHLMIREWREFLPPIPGSNSSFLLVKRKATEEACLCWRILPISKRTGLGWKTLLPCGFTCSSMLQLCLYIMISFAKLHTFHVKEALLRGIVWNLLCSNINAIIVSDILMNFTLYCYRYNK